MPRPQLRYRLGSAFAHPKPSPPPTETYVDGPGDTGFQNRPGYAGNIAGSGLIDGSGITVQSGQTYVGYRNLGGYGQIGHFLNPVHDVTFIGCMWEQAGKTSAAVVLAADGPITFDWCTIRPTGTAEVEPVSMTEGYQFAIVADGTQAEPGTYNSYCQQLTVSRTDIWGFANATKIGAGTVARPHDFTGVWWHAARENTDGSDHTDGPGNPGGGGEAYATYDRCRIEALGDTNGMAYQALPSGPGSTVTDHITVRRTLFGGFGNCVAITAGNFATAVTGGTNVTFTDNTFSTELDCALSPLYTTATATGSGNVWARNRWKVPPGAYWGNPAHDGWFWLPVDQNRNRTTGDDTPYVSATDYTG